MVHQRAYLARHLRTLSLEMMQAGAQICRQLDPDLEPSWASIILRLGQGNSITVAGVAEMMNVSHVHALKLLRAMKTKGVVSGAVDPNDGRSTIYTLTKKGSALVPKVALITGAAERIIADIENETGQSLADAIGVFKGALNKKGWAERLVEKIDSKEDTPS